MMHKTVTVFGKQVPVWVLAAAAGALGLVLVMRARSKGTSVVSAGTTAAAAAAAQAASAATIYDPNLQGLVSGSPYAGTVDYGAEMAQIQAQLAALANPAPAAPAAPIYTDVSKATRSGAGYYEGTWGDLAALDVVTAGGSFNTVTQQQMAALTAAGQSVYFQNAPGVFTAIPGGDWKTVGGDTAVYQMTHPPAGAATTSQVASHT